VLEDEGAGGGGQEVEGRGQVDAGLEAVVHDRQVAVLRQASDASRFGEAPAARHVDLHHVDLATVHQVQVGVAAGLLLTGGDADVHRLREARVAGEVVGVQDRKSVV